MEEFRPVGDRSWLVTCPDPPGLARAVRAACAARGVPLAEVVPAARTVLVQAGPGADLTALRAVLVDIGDDHDTVAQLPAPVELTVDFDGPDLGDVAAACGRTTDAVVALVTGTTFTAAFTGFAPGFAYLTGLPAVLALPRRPQPRTRVPAGSLAIADTYAAVYPRASPGGWHLLGHTDSTLFDPDRDVPALIAAGAVVRFRARA